MALLNRIGRILHRMLHVRRGCRGAAASFRTCAASAGGKASEAAGRLRRPGRVGSGKTRALAVLLLASVAGCALVSVFGTAKQPFVFSHKVHVVDQSLDCGDCHLTWETADDPGMPVVSQCMLCHQEIDAKKPPERRIETLFDGKTFKASHAMRLPGEVVFSHQRHATKVEKCSSCHTGIEQNTAVSASMKIGMQTCHACHAERGVQTTCATCHKEVRMDKPPATHTTVWLRTHGRVVRAHNQDNANRCSLCHQESSCASCHLVQEPASHNDYFRLRGHGLMARMDRQSCAVCHRSDSCESCHQQTQPLSHVGSWGGVRNNHCITCHFPLGKDECSTCHKDAPSHALAAPMPANHTPGMNCRQCHGLTAPLPHVDKGDECSRCHR
jgi:Cytochrome c3